MPELCRMHGIIIKMLNYDNVQHNEPHIHVFYGEYKASISLNGILLAGNFPIKQFRIVTGWLALRETEVYEAWAKAINGEPFEKIAPIE